MTPSQAHDSAFTRTPEHDLMVVEVYEYLKEYGLLFMPTFEVYEGGTKVKRGYSDTFTVECERLYKAERSVFFADIAMTFSVHVPGEGRNQGENYYHHVIFEVKPKIYSAGAILRQVKTQRRQIDGWLEHEKGKQHWSRPNIEATVAPVFRRDDPLIPIYDRMTPGCEHFYMWDNALISANAVRKAA